MSTYVLSFPYIEMNAGKSLHRQKSYLTQLKYSSIKKCGKILWTEYWSKYLGIMEKFLLCINLERDIWNFYDTKRRRMTKTISQPPKILNLRDTEESST